MNKIVLVLMLLVAPVAFADDVGTKVYAGAVGMLFDATDTTCTGDCVAIQNTSGSSVGLLAGVQYGFLAGELAVTLNGVSPWLFLRHDIADFKVGAGVGLMPVKRTLNYATASATETAFARVVALDISYKYLYVRAGIGNVDFSTEATEFIAPGPPPVYGTTYKSNISQDGKFIAVGIIFPLR